MKVCYCRRRENPGASSKNSKRSGWALRKLLNRLLRPAGYRIERLSRFRTELDRLLKRGTWLKSVQIGANDGVRFDDLYRTVTNGPFRGIVVEPLPDVFERLQANYAGHPQIVPINVAIHAHERALALYRVNPQALPRYSGWADGIASFDREHLIRHGIAASDIVAVEVQCEPLMALLRRTDMLDAHLLQIDTEGYDAAVVAMIDFDVVRPQLIKFEHKNVDPRVYGDTLRLMRTNGYRCYREGSDTVCVLRKRRNAPAFNDSQPT
jgi:FkbM family methyltransferase